eukprot:1182164-Prorocentrum_minimum.AAC.1
MYMRRLVGVYVHESATAQAVVDVMIHASAIVGDVSVHASATAQAVVDVIEMNWASVSIWNEAGSGVYADGSHCPLDVVTGRRVYVDGSHCPLDVVTGRRVYVDGSHCPLDVVTGRRVYVDGVDCGSGGHIGGRPRPLGAFLAGAACPKHSGQNQSPLGMYFIQWRFQAAGP